MDNGMMKLLAIYDQIKAVARENNMPVKDALECLELIRRINAKEALWQPDERKEAANGD